MSDSSVISASTKSDSKGALTAKNPLEQVHKAEQKAEKDIRVAKETNEEKLDKIAKEYDTKFQEEIDQLKESGKKGIIEFKEKRVKKYKEQVREIQEKVSSMSTRSKDLYDEAIDKIVAEAMK